jgi:hypothetical protein
MSEKGRNTMSANSIRIASVGLALLAACSSGGDDGNGSLTSGGGAPSPPAPTQYADNPSALKVGVVAPGATAASGGADPNLMQNPNIAQRAVNYGEAFRTASLKLTGELPALADIKSIANAGTADQQKPVYDALIDKLLADPRFAAAQIRFWRNTFKTGGAGDGMGGPSFDTAATFAAMVVVNDRPFTDLFTASAGTCPTYKNGVFTAAECGNGAPVAGVLSDPGLMAQFYSNMAFRRVRFVQETFACAKFPAEYSQSPTPMGSSIYTSPWSFNSIAGGASAKVNFHDTSAVICANCHTTMNHIAPIFGQFDENGAYQMDIQVMTPVTPPVKTVRADWLPANEPLAWRNGTQVTDLPTLGQAMAKDPEIAACAVNRIWNWGFSRGDIVNDLASIPPVVTSALIADFAANGMKVKRLIRSVLTSDDFVRF